jgi:hypothetical protein
MALNHQIVTLKHPHSPTLLDPNQLSIFHLLLSVELWYAMKLSESQDDFEYLENFFGLTVDTLNLWCIAQNFCPVNGSEKDDDHSAKYDMPSPVASSTPPISRPAYVAPAPVIPFCRSHIKLNISDNPKLKE